MTVELSDAELETIRYWYQVADQEFETSNSCDSKPELIALKSLLDKMGFRYEADDAINFRKNGLI